MIHALLAVSAIVTTIAGVPGTPGFADGPANAALFNKPTQISVDYANGDIYAVDRVNNAVRKISKGAVSTFLQSPVLNFDGPMNGGVVIEPPGDYIDSYGYGRGVFIAASGEHIIVQRDIFNAAFVHDVFWVGVKEQPGANDGSVDVLPGPMFNGPTAMTIDRRRYPVKCCLFAPREIFIADTGNGSIRKLTRTINGEAEYVAHDVTTFARGFVAPRGLAFGPDGSLYVTDAGLNTVVRIAPDGTSTVVAGQPAVAGNADGVPGLLDTPTGIDVDNAGNVYIADTANGTIRRLRPDGYLETVAGAAGQGGYVDGDALLARFNGPVGLQVAPDGSVIVADTSNHVIRKITFTTLPQPKPRRRGVRH